MIDPISLCQELIRCESVTPKDAGCLDIIEGYLKPLGFVCHRLPFGQNDPLATDNLYARWGNSGPNFCFAGHTDVVPVGDLARWTVDPFGADIKDGRLYGRGTVDMKGAIAAFISAVADVIQNHQPGCSFSLLLTSDEEGPATFGTKKVIEWLKGRGEIIDACLVGEPTNPQIFGEMVKIGRRGSLNTKVTVTGKQGHVAYPHFAVNPIPALLGYLMQLLQKPLDEGTDHFMASNLEVTSVDVGNPVTNVIPNQASARFNIRFNSLHTGQRLVDYLQAVKEMVSKTFSPQLQWTLEPVISGESFMSNHQGLQQAVVKAIETVTGLTPKLDTSGGTSDARFLKDICPVIEFGLISDQAHQIDEYLVIEDLTSLTGVYKNILCQSFLEPEDSNLREIIAE
ncbi:succinyl-diaminopimelate desuccinylase [Candidatus Finniella inopinata]|uniref:Succinyl-diaminopimelate desuccinylase n=1 Tax=Candidatus Finniella inopinata TaxID=1696036 RepID=A0A4Q7DKZ6_9PROT|nr:succinyl-diaminopimelate desuccinylase [Candidatus Finniella inopinata]RZI45366.1 succinyl-diaminopimelate desuccinylase [Candidatus Finniella inopinata]